MSNHIPSDDEVKFIKEKRIIQNPLKKQLKVLLKVAIYGLVFGGVAAISYAMILPFAGKIFKPETRQETVSIDLETSIELPVETIQETTVVETEPVEEIVDNAIKNYDYSVDTVKNLISSLSALADEKEQSFVRVMAVKNGTDWFNNEMQTSGFLSGVVIAETETEFMILAPIGELETADSLKITFFNHAQVEGSIKEYDKFCGLSILSVLKENMDDDTKEKCRVIALGNAYNLRRGDIVIAMGSPLGVVGSVTYGNISYVSNNTSVVDGFMRLMYSDATSDIAKGSFFVNTEGELIGWASGMYAEGSSATIIAGLSDFKSIIEKMTNAEKNSFVGIRGTDVMKNMQESGIPSGLYVVDVTKDSPAYVSGIQPGDIVTKIGEAEINSNIKYKNAIDALTPDETVTFTLVRYAKDEYKEIKIDVTVGSR